MKKFCKVMVVALSVVMLTGSGCGGRKVARVTYQPVAIEELERLKPTTIRVEVIDERPSAERGQVGKYKTGVVVLAKDAPMLVFDAIRAGLEKQGHRVVAGAQDTANAELVVKITRYYLEVKPTIFTVVKTASLQGEASTRRAGRDERERSIPFRGTYEKVYQAYGSQRPHEALSGALTDAVNQLLIDERFLETLRSAQNADSL